jgi:hypothetical protein
VVMTTHSPSSLRAADGKKAKPRPHTIVTIVVCLTVIFYLPLWLSVQMNLDLPVAESSSGLGSGIGFGVPSLESFGVHSHERSTHRRANVVGSSLRMIDSTKSSGKIQDLEERVRYLETKLNSYLAFASDPFLGTKSSAKCNNEKYIKDIACPTNPGCALDDQVVCLDSFPHVEVVNEQLLRGVDQNDGAASSAQQEGCVVYDFGIRESPEYGLVFSQAPFNCEVTGFDPSPISIEWWKKNQQTILQDHPKYNFMAVGAGGVDGPLALREYDWGQVSILEYPQRVVDPTNCTHDGACRYKFYNQKSFTIPVKTLQTIMTELGHSYITLLKLVRAILWIFLSGQSRDVGCLFPALIASSLFVF